MRHIQAMRLVVGIIPQVLDPDGPSLVGASLRDLRVSALKYFERFLVVAVCRYAC